MTARLATLRPKLQKLIPRLASDHDGEVVATVRALERTLQQAGLDFHALADDVGRETPQIVYVVPKASVDTAPPTWFQIAQFCASRSAHLLEYERDFVENMEVRLVCGGEPSAKQADWLRRLYARLKREGL